jgi:hypothetical protein
MRHEDIAEPLRTLAFDFFFFFSRFEFALKEAGYLKSDKPEAAAQAGWGRYTKAFEAQYVLSAQGQALIDAQPQKQVVAANQDLVFSPVTFKAGDSDLEKVTMLARTVRNNLFHGGKHVAKGWDDPKRMRNLLEVALATLDDLAEQTGLQADYTGHY